MKRKLFLMIVSLAALGAAGCDDYPLESEKEGKMEIVWTEPTRNSDFEAPALTDDNSITLEVEADPGGVIELGILGDRAVVEWGDGSVTKDNFEGVLPIDQGERIFFRHRYTEKGQYRVRVWSEKTTYFSTHNIRSGIGGPDKSGIRHKTIAFGNCPLLGSITVGLVEENTALDLRGCPELTYPLIKGFTGLESIDFSGNPMMTHTLIVDNPRLAELDFGHNPELKTASCFRNASLAKINLEGCDKLDDIDFSGSAVAEFDFGAFPLLNYIGCSNTLLGSVDVTGNPVLGVLHCRGLGLASLDLSANPLLGRLDAAENRLTALDITANPRVEYLDVDSNSLTSLDVSSQTRFTDLYLRDNEFGKDALNNLFSALPQAVRTRLSLMPLPSAISITGNPGTETCDTKLITDKGWRIVDSGE